MTVAGQAIAIAQAAPAVATPLCTFTLAPSSVTAPAAGTTFMTTLTTSVASCVWSAVANAAWLSVSSASGAGSTTISVKVSAATANGTRNGTITAGGQTLTVQQFGKRKK